jgi:type I site-specific restriction endonuclease
MQARLESIYEKIQKLVTLIKELKTENEKLKSDIELSRDVQNRLKNDLEKLLVEKESNLNNLKFNTLAAENLTKEQIKAQIDQYISEIDNCIAQIEKL